MCTGGLGNCGAVRLVTMRPRSTDQHVTLEGHLVALSLSLFIYPMAIQMIFQQTMEAKMARGHMPAAGVKMYIPMQMHIHRHT